MIVFTHLLNDRSGSPRVLKSVIENTGSAERAKLYIGSDGDGILAAVEIETRKYWYRRTRYRVLTMATFFISQAHLLWSLLRSRDIPGDAVVYVNTLLPFGAGLFGCLTNRPVVYHIHEVSLSPVILQKFLVAMARISATRLIYVSDSHQAMLPIAPRRSVVVYNTIDKSLAASALSHDYRHRQDGLFVVLMLASARVYKGLPEFMNLARSFAGRTDIAFHLVLSDANEVDEVASNVTLLPPANDTARYYAGASVVLNLSRPDLWVETFGLTVLEAMAFGIPVIAPPVGGPAELVTDGREGFLIDSRNGDGLATAVARLADDEALCLRMSHHAKTRAAQFGHEAFRDGIADVVEAARG